ncbi:MAG: helix-turn-helix transcriptional regulator [Desulfobulbaceae bacterium]|nr:helix-turn-helix transcriptional regulator [Desulfobulbaceae bacterium]
MTNPEINNGNPDNFPGGPPMVKIDGATVRRLREQKGLTQLYVATVVQVTTDTISRWENRRYPSIKKENAEKLAEALEVDLAALLEQLETPAPSAAAPVPEPARVSEPETAAPAMPLPPDPRRRLLLGLAVTLLLALTLTLLFRFGSGSSREPLPTFAATRILPAHVPPGQEFPVLLRVSAQPAAALALIIRENLPPGCQFILASPALTGASGPDGQIKWVSRLEGKERLFGYLLTSPAGAAFGSALSFRGQLVAGSRGEATAMVSGSEQMVVSPFHWADSNGDNRIDDEEILVVYDRFGDLEEFAALRDELDQLWTGGGYRWDASSHKYLVGK